MLIWFGMRKLILSRLVAVSSQHNLDKSENKSINKLHNLFFNDIFVYFSKLDNNYDNNKSKVKLGFTTAEMYITRKNRIKWREKIIYHFLLLQHFLCLFKLQ